MALGADLNVYVLLCGTCYESISAVTGHGSLIVIRMDPFLHVFTSSFCFVNFNAGAVRGCPLSGSVSGIMAVPVSGFNLPEGSALSGL